MADLSSSSSESRNIKPGPDNPSLLKFQSSHVSERVWNGKPDRILKCRRAQYIRAGRVGIPEQIVPLLRRAGFLGAAQLHFFQVEPTLITALVERWRPETHTFHMPPGECTITLQDMAIQVGLRVDGRPLISDTSPCNWHEVAERVLGIAPPDDAIHCGGLKMKWLSDTFSNVEDHVGDEQQLLRFTRAYILRLIGGVIFPDQSSSRVSLRYLRFLEDLDECGEYSWGSAALSYLYRELCNSTKYERVAICGLHFLIQVWAWDRFPRLAPTAPIAREAGTPYGARWLGSDTFKAVRRDINFYRHTFDSMRRTDIVWMPYGDDVLQTLPDVCLQGSDGWRAMVPLLFNNIVEWHQPDRVMRQFGMQQHIPGPPRQPDNIHGITLKGKTGENWVDVYRPFIEMWNDRLNFVCTNPPQVGLLSANSEYMKWYAQHTRRWITRKYAVRGRSFDVMEFIHHLSSPESQSDGQSPAAVFDTIRQEIENVIMMWEQEDRLVEAQTPAPTPIQEPPAVEVNINMPKNRVERQGIQRRRTCEDREDYIIPPLPPRLEGNRDATTTRLPDQVESNVESESPSTSVSRSKSPSTSVSESLSFREWGCNDK